MIISVASGKGGTGKTTFAVNFSYLLDNTVIVDCDVEAPNVSIFLKPEIEKKEIVSLPYPEIDKNKCIYCGKCAEVCAYNAINVFNTGKTKSIFVMEHLCHNCGACSYFCPQNAISEVERRIGVIEIGKNEDGIEYIGGILDKGEIKTPSMIKEVKKRIDKSRNVVIDSPPGASCPMVNAVSDSDFCVLVTEPTEFGLNDLLIARDTVEKLNIPNGVVINRWNNNVEFEKRLNSLGMKILGKIPFDREIAEIYSKGGNLINFKNYGEIFSSIKNKIIQEIKV